tara:strand:+ start:137835 stop:139988 length:2154 start_codon:yes stop_codon:yes gene_type:complete
MYCILFALLHMGSVSASGSNDLWITYRKVEDAKVSSEYRHVFSNIHFSYKSPILRSAAEELQLGVNGMLGQNKVVSLPFSDTTTMVILPQKELPDSLRSLVSMELDQLSKDGFLIKSVSYKKREVLVLSAQTDLGVLYGTFHLLRKMQMNLPLSKTAIMESPKIDFRILNHWDNLDRTVERGYAGFSIWNWHKLPDYKDPRYKEYARANASIGINGTVLTNVNANALVLTPSYIEKVRALAEIFRPYGIRVYLTARFSAPMEIGGLETADPLDQKVISWWKQKTADIYKEIPDFGGFLIKANSEGQPGPQNYGRTHVDGANMMADAVAPFGGMVMWRAFVYSDQDPTDRAKQAYSEFVPFDGRFRDNVLVQVKNGAIDFQPREPFHPMFGAMPSTQLMMEFQITQEYLGFSTHLVFLPKLFQEVLEADTYRREQGATVANVVDGSLHSNKITGMAGVANIGTDLNWTGHPFGQANWYGYGRMAWDPYTTAETIADEWLKMTFGTNPKFIEPMTKLLLDSREAVVNYMTPLGLHHIMDTGHHYGPGPWIGNLSRPEWNPTYYHRADSLGIGFDRSKSGSNATAQYAPALSEKWGDPATTPEELLLWFHHLPWDYELKNGNILWNGIALKYQEGVDQVKRMGETWEKMEPYVESSYHQEVAMLLGIQLKESQWWRDACLLYFQQFSKRPLPKGVPEPTKTLEEFKSLKFPFAPGIRPQW